VRFIRKRKDKKGVFISICWLLVCVCCDWYRVWRSFGCIFVGIDEVGDMKYHPFCGYCGYFFCGSEAEAVDDLFWGCGRGFR
jgi:hypothetical protein